MTRINHEEGDAETADVANLGEAVGTLSLSPAASEPATIDPSDESFSRGSETSSGPTIRLFIGDLHRSTTEVSRRLHVEALSNNALLWRRLFYSTPLTDFVSQSTGTCVGAGAAAGGPPGAVGRSGVAGV
jgi:hypothetical protein